MWSARSRLSGGSSVRRTSYRRTTSRRAAERQAYGTARRAAKIAAYREASVLANIATRGLQLGRGELKAVDLWSGNAIVGDHTAPTVQLINGVARGDDINERIGRQITMKSVQVSAVLVPNTTQASQVPSCVRMMIVFDRQANAAAPTLASLVVTHNVADAVIGLRNLEYRERFQVIKDDIISLPGSSSTAYQDGPRTWKVYLPVNLVTTFNNGDAGSIADIATGSLYLMMYSNVAAGQPYCAWSSRVRYADN